MKFLTRVLCILLAAFIMFGCSILSPTATPANTSQAPSPVNTPVMDTPTVPTVAAPSVPALTAEMLANFTYLTPYTPDSRLPLQNGQFDMNQEDPPAKVFSRLSTTAFGDLNGDGAEDAVAVLATNTGGTGTFFDLIALLNQNGAPLQIATTSFGDRQFVKGLRIENGLIILDYMTQGPQDGACCPSQHNLRTYILEGGRLSLTSEQILESEAAQATPVPNHIIIDYPQGSEQILGKTVGIRGRVSQTPASGALTYHLTSIDGALVREGTLPVTGTPGGLGVFDFQVPLDGVQYLAYIDIIDSQNGLLLGRTSTVLLLPGQ
jgi:hypothetical protein